MTSEITFTPATMSAEELRVEMILSSLLPPYSSSTKYSIRATDGAMLYHYRSDEFGNVLTGTVISLAQPSMKLRILETNVDRNRLKTFKELLVVE